MRASLKAFVQRHGDDIGRSLMLLVGVPLMLGLSLSSMLVMTKLLQLVFCGLFGCGGA